MRVLDTISIEAGDRQSTIELCEGDLTAMPDDHGADVLVVSAYEDSYLPTPGSLIGALMRKGVSVEQLAGDKEVDLRSAFSCWLSRALKDAPPGVPYKRILCFESTFRGRPPELVGDIFRALAPFLAGPPPLSTVAMPIVAAGDQRYPIETMLDSLLRAAIHWMRAGMPLRKLIIAVLTPEQAERARQIFARHKSDVASGSAPALRRTHDFDVFVSYSREDAAAVDVLVRHLHERSVKLFLDRLALAEGAAWQPQLFSAIDRCDRLVAVYSPAYVRSKVCQEEFNIAWARGRQLGTDTIFPVYWRSAELPTYMSMLVYADCREQQVGGLAPVADRIASLTRV